MYQKLSGTNFSRGKRNALIMNADALTRKGNLSTTDYIPKNFCRQPEMISTQYSMQDFETWESLI